LVQAFAQPGCARFVAVGLGLFIAWTFSPPGERWAEVPVDVETAARPSLVDPIRVEIEGLLGAQLWGDADQRAGVAHAILEESRAAGLDPLLVMAVIQVESELHADAVSAAGARGLMQLRPPTFKFIAELEGVGLPADKAAQDDPILNVRLGIRYLKLLAGSFDSLGVALVAYNAGPHRVNGYLNRGEPIPESLRSYPHRVRRAYEAFVNQLGEDPAIAALGFPPSPEVAER
jgi:soluble lytic murein transglycosylase-like protein